MLLSGNSIEEAVLLLAAEYVGIPTAPVSPAYSLLSRDFARIRGVAGLFPPAAVFVQSGARFERALAALELGAAPVIAVSDAAPGQLAWADLVAAGLSPERLAAVDAAHSAMRMDDTVRVLFTSGSTGAPKSGAAHLPQFQDRGRLLRREPRLAARQPAGDARLAAVEPRLRRRRQPGPPAFTLGASYYIDDGRPLPGHFERSVHDLCDVSPTMFATCREPGPCWPPSWSATPYWRTASFRA